MTKVNYNNWVEYYNSYEDSIDMTDTSVDGNDKIDARKIDYPMDIRGGKGNDTIYGSKNHINELYGDYMWDLLGNVPESYYNSFSGNDKIYGGNKFDFIQGGLGNDDINAGKGTNILMFKKGDGNDIVYQTSGKDYFYFCDATFAELKYERRNNDLIIHYGNNDTVTVENHYNSPFGSSFKGIMDSDTDITELKELLSNINLTESEMTSIANRTLRQAKSISSLLDENGMIITATKGTTIKATSKDDTINGSKRKDKIYGYAGNDIIKAGKGNDYINGGKGNDTIYGQDGNDTIKGSNGHDYLSGGKGNDKIYGQKGNNVISGGKGNDKMWSGTGADTFEISKKSGKDVIYKANSDDTLYYKDADLNDLSFKQKGKDLVITRKNGSKKETVTISKYFSTSDKIDNLKLKDGQIYSLADNVKVEISGRGKIYGTSANEIIKGSIFRDTIMGYGGNDAIDAGKAKDTINAGTGQNVIYFNKKSGDDTVISGGGTDILAFSDEKNITDLKLIQKSNDLLIYHKGGTVTLKNYAAGNHSAKFIHVGSNLYSMYAFYNLSDNGKVAENVIATNSGDAIALLDSKGVKNLYAVGGNDTVHVAKGVNVYGGVGNDTLLGNGSSLYGEAGDDTLYAGYYEREDLTNKCYSSKLYGGDGNDTYAIYFPTNVGASNPVQTISDSSGTDSLRLSDSQNNFSVFFNVKADGSMDNNLFIRNNVELAGGSAEKPVYNTVKINNYFTANGKIESIRTTNGTSATDDDYTLNSFNVDRIKQSVAGWLSTNSYADVNAAITDSAKGAENFALLMTDSKYFGQITWQNV